MAPLSSDKVEWGMQSAMTWLREKKYTAADAAFLALSQEAERAGLGLHEASIHRMMAQYQQDPGVALKHLATADGLLQAHSDLVKTEKDEEHAQILCWRAQFSERAGDHAAADKAVHELDVMVAGSRSDVIWRSYNGAAGAVLAARGKYPEAIPYLQEDQESAFSMRLLKAAYENTGAAQQAADEQKLLLTKNTPTLDQAVVVVGERASQAANVH
jgi:hypothetical protein